LAQGSPRDHNTQLPLEHRLQTTGIPALDDSAPDHPAFGRQEVVAIKIN